MFGVRPNWLVLSLLLCWHVMEAQSPHGENFTVDCKACHTTSSWELDRDSLTFDHATTGFELEGQHSLIDCRMCHDELIFTGANQECFSCHTDMHQQTVGTDCARCHSPESWIVDNITQIHEQIAFPLVGAHQVPNCFECHTSETNLRFEPIGVDCINCHGDDYAATTNPNHEQAGFSTDCSECHTIFAFEWEATGINHDFFPLTLGHDINDCTACHADGDYASTSPDCFGCHEDDFQATANPDHMATGFSTNCLECHTTNPGWMPAEFRDHDGMFFPIYSGEHAGEWSSCVECHTDANDFSIFSCIGCHEHNQEDMDDEHEGVQGYSYNSDACFACHPTGRADGSLDHGFFPLTLGHDINECTLCHQDPDYSNISPECLSCHEMDYEGTQNPAHTVLGLSTDCASCHTTQPDWNPASFDVHDEYYMLNGAHAVIRNECATCHNGDYNNTPNTCFGCHQDDFESTTDPDHQNLQFSTECTDCHNETAWTPSTFDHDGQFFPIYSGEHAGEWTSCSDCHNVPGDYSIFVCTTCHMADETGDEHEGIQGYVHNSDACLACHPTGSADDDFNHDMTGFSLTGSHLSVQCLECHTSGFENTPNDCFACHQMDYEGTQNPDHQQLGLSTDCASCHTTAPDWNPATFDVHNEYYTLNGAHSAIANDCASCHNGDYINTPNTCFGCHQSDFEGTTDPDHQSLQFSMECTDCHNESAWVPSTFDHDGQFFPIYSGEHAGEWTQCLDCHTTPGDYTVYTCTTCHEMGETDEEHEGVGGYFYNSTACLACHPTGSADEIFDHNMTGFPLTGAHTMTDCIDCHDQGFEGTSTECVACHQEDYNSSENPNHQSLGLPTDCASCHTTAPDWNPATFDIHDEYYVLNGAHAMIATECVACHSGDYTNTPNTCFGCHETDYNSTTDPDHQALQFSTECTDCHNEGAWTPSTFDHDGQFFPIYSGKHAGEWSQCVDCHTTPGDYSVFTCTTCHEMGETDEEHDEVGGYVYNSEACFACHPTGSADELFDHNMTGFPLTGAHMSIECLDCHDMGFDGTSTDCASCHTEDYNGSTNPDHETLGLPMDCAICHTTAPDWNPATFDVHNEYYELMGAHAAIANDCAACHNGDYNNTPNTCYGCHQSDYESTTDPDHQVAQFSTDCATCHTESSWIPSTFDHDGQYFPINSGTHAGVWTQCLDCHTNPNDYSIFTCTTCHESGETGGQHTGVGGYIYESNACFACHPTGTAEGAIDHDATDFPLTGAHLTAECLDCHAGGYQGTPTECVACHQQDYDQSSNPNHVDLGLPTDCASCHTTAPDWNPATFDIHNEYYALNGAHAAISNDCIACHNGDYNNTPNTCFGCHQDDYDQTADPPHENLQFSTECLDCHNENDWADAMIDHDGPYFPIYTGAHAGQWDMCSQCHTNSNDYGEVTCMTCHFEGETGTQHTAVAGYVYNDAACLACHPTGDAEGAFDHNNTGFPLTGAHLTVDCFSCHDPDFSPLSPECSSCHIGDYNQSVNPDHESLNLPTDCASCHTTDPDWSPATFDIHDDYYALNGAHATISNDCVACHNGDYNNTPNTCFGCHEQDYNSTIDPDHEAAMFPTDCIACHNETAWVPSTFDHDGMYFPIYSGKHDGEWNQCSDCHTNPNDYSVFDCLGCHPPAATAAEHDQVPLYIYESNACFECHPQGED